MSIVSVGKYLLEKTYLFYAIRLIWSLSVNQKWCLLCRWVPLCILQRDFCTNTFVAQAHVSQLGHWSVPALEDPQAVFFTMLLFLDVYSESGSFLVQNAFIMFFGSYFKYYAWVLSNIYLALIGNLFKNDSVLLPNSSAALRKVLFWSKWSWSGHTGRDGIFCSYTYNFNLGVTCRSSHLSKKWAAKSSGTTDFFAKVESFPYNEVLGFWIS